VMELWESKQWGLRGGLHGHVAHALAYLGVQTSLLSSIAFWTAPG